MAYTVVQANGNAGVGNGTTIAAAALGSAVTNGNSIIVAVSQNSNTVTVNSITINSGSATFSRIGRFQDSTNLMTVELWGANNVSGVGQTYTANFSGTVNGRGIVVMEVSGFGSSGINLDKTATSSQTAQSSPTTGTTATTTQANEFWVNVWYYWTGGDGTTVGTFSAPSNSYTIPTNGSFTSSSGVSPTKSITGICVATRDVTSTGTGGGTVTLSVAQDQDTSMAFTMYGPTSAAASHLLACLGCGG